MKKLYNIFAPALVILISLVAMTLSACSSSDVDGNESGPSITNSDHEATLTPTAEASSVTINFKANGAWTATSSNEECATISSAASGSAGAASITVVVKENYGSARTADIIVKAAGCNSSRLCRISQAAGAGDGSAIEKMDAYLKTHYLWNAEYKTLDLTAEKKLAYNKFLSSALMKMTTNTLDKKSHDDGKTYRIYSFVKRSAISSTSSTRADIVQPSHGVKPEKAYTYGVASILPIYMDATQTTIGFGIDGVYPDSPAAKAGLKRGMIITKINNTSINSNNWESFYSLLFPNKTGTQLVISVQGDTKEYKLSSEYMEENVVLKSEIITNGTHKIGYLVYSSFVAGYDGYVIKALKQFKDGGVTDMILDLRLNGGGHVVSADLISSCIAGTASKDKVFQYYRYNDDRMATSATTAKETGTTYDSTNKLFFEKFSYPTYWSVDIAPASLNLQTLYCITSSDTASASECVINSLRGLDINVVTIGDTSSGKNVGMESISFTAGNYEYEFYPISFQGYNCKKYSLPSTGITPDYAIDDWNGGKSYADFSQTEVCVAKAISLITGSAAPTSTRASAGTMRQAAAAISNPHTITGSIILPRDKQE